MQEDGKRRDAAAHPGHVAESSKIRESEAQGPNRENGDNQLFSCFFDEILYQDRIDPEFLYHIQTVQD